MKPKYKEGDCIVILKLKKEFSKMFWPEFEDCIGKCFQIKKIKKKGIFLKSVNIHLHKKIDGFMWVGEDIRHATEKEIERYGAKLL